MRVIWRALWSIQSTFWTLWWAPGSSSRLSAHAFASESVFRGLSALVLGSQSLLHSWTILDVDQITRDMAIWGNFRNFRLGSGLLIAAIVNAASRVGSARVLKSLMIRWRVHSSISGVWFTCLAMLSGSWVVFMILGWPRFRRIQVCRRFGFSVLLPGFYASFRRAWPLLTSRSVLSAVSLGA